MKVKMNFKVVIFKTVTLFLGLILVGWTALAASNTQLNGAATACAKDLAQTSASQDTSGSRYYDAVGIVTNIVRMGTIRTLNRKDFKTMAAKLSLLLPYGSDLSSALENLYFDSNLVTMTKPTYVFLFENLRYFTRVADNRHFLALKSRAVIAK